MTAARPGYYEAQGDPLGTVRYWDGTAWTSEPMPAPPGFDAAHDPRFARAWIRIGASFLDGAVGLMVALPFLIPWLGDIFEEINAGVEPDQINASVPAAFYLVGIATTLAYVFMIAFLGGTPGKLMLGLRVTTDDGSTTPPGLPKAFLRTIPQLVGAIPFIGAIIALGAQVLSLVWVNTDGERRSAYDRIAGTRVVYRSRL